LVEIAKARHYKELQIWQKSLTLCKAVYLLTEKLPKHETYGLTAQMRRAAVSVPSNIAEGQARKGPREFLQFLSHASGSLAELETQTLLAVELAYFAEADAIAVLDLIGEVQKMMVAIRRKLEGC
jgi:four helix bundle protein